MTTIMEYLENEGLLKGGGMIRRSEILSEKRLQDLRKNPGLTVNELGEMWGVDSRSAGFALRRLIREGKAYREGGESRGYYGTVPYRYYADPVPEEHGTTVSG